ncbi:MAG: hypothetical protein JWL83_1721 [Actinomycetia bacterium]|nr:hypothetical protein [Actinomycetes bacterium]
MEPFDLRVIPPTAQRGILSTLPARDRRLTGARSRSGYRSNVASGPAGGLRGRRASQWWVIAMALAVIGAIAIADAATTAVLAPAVVAGPFLVAVFDDGPTTAFVGALAVVAAAVSLGLQDISGTQQAADVAVVAIGAVAATLVAARRTRREAELQAARPEIDLARRLKLALDAGRMGSWSWDMRTNAVDWDDLLEPLFGVEPGTFEKTFEAWKQTLHPEDRERMLETVEKAVAAGAQFRMDHRTIWPDGSVHWIEGRGEAVFDAAGNVIGATGVAIDIDDRHRADLERATLLASEREARRAAERSMAALTHLQDVTLGLSGASTVDEIADLILEHGISALGARTGYFATVDTEQQTLVMRSQVGYPPNLIDQYRFVEVSASLPAPEVLRTGNPMFVESPVDGVARYPHFPRDDMHGAFVVYPLFVDGTPGGVIALGFDESRHFPDEDRAFIGAVMEACAQALQRALLFEAEQTVQDRLRLLLHASERLAALDDPDTQLQVAADIAADRIGRWATIQLFDGRGALQRVAVSHADRDRVAELEQLLALDLDGGVTSREVIESGRPVLLPRTPATTQPVELSDDVRLIVERVGWRSGIVAPMIAGGRCVGVLTIGDDRPVRLGHVHLEVAMDLGRRSASAYERARLLRSEQELAASALRESQAQLEAEHRLVALLQSSILPDALPNVPGLEFAACYHPAESGIEVGGDWYDAFDVDGGGIVIVIGDVAGHGIAAATLMGRVRNAARAFAVEDPDPGTLLRRLDRVLRVLEDEAMVTAIASHFDPTTRVLSWARAGHPPALVCTGERTEFLDSIGGTPLGAMATEYQVAQHELEPGALLVLFTDGLVERRSAPIDDGLAWLAQRVAATPDADLEVLCEALLDERYSGRPSLDDICVIAMRVQK